MNIVITMGGLGSRFRKAGYSVPKYEIMVLNKTLFEWSMLSLNNFFDEDFIFCVRKDDNAVDFITEKCKELGIKGKIVELKDVTKGQAETVLFARNLWKPKDELFIYNIDTYVESDELSQECIHGDGFIPCFSSAGNHWSFVKLDVDGRALEVREKERISDNCSIGAYYFSSADLYENIYYEYYGNGARLEHGEEYIAPMYNLMIKNKYDVYIQSVPSEKVHVLGTPEEVDQFKSNITF